MKNLYPAKLATDAFAEVSFEAVQRLKEEITVLRCKLANALFKDIQCPDHDDRPAVEAVLTSGSEDFSVLHMEACCSKPVQDAQRLLEVALRQHPRQI